MRLFRRREHPDPLSAEVRIGLLRLPEDIPGGVQAEARVFRQLRAEAASEAFESEGVRVAAEAIDGACISWQGSPRLVGALCPAFFDKLLVNLVSSPALAKVFAATVERYLKQKQRRADVPFAEVVPLVGLSQNFLSIKLPNGPPIQNLYLDSALRQGMIESAEAEVVVRAAILHNHKCLGAETFFEPLEASNPMVGELAFWALWDWVCLSLAGDSPPTVFDVLRSCLIRQCEIYGEQGFPSPLDVGLTPYKAAVETGLIATG